MVSNQYDPFLCLWSGFVTGVLCSHLCSGKKTLEEVSCLACIICLKDAYITRDSLQIALLHALLVDKLIAPQDCYTQVFPIQLLLVNPDLCLVLRVLILGTKNGYVSF